MGSDGWRIHAAKNSARLGNSFLPSAPRPPHLEIGRFCPCRRIPGGFKPAALRTLRLRRCRCGTHRPPLLKTFSAIDRTSLRGLERNRSFFSALRAHRLGFDPLCATRTIALRAMSFACLAPLGLVLEALVGEKHLLAGGKDELTSALAALQDLIVIFHMLLRHGVGTGLAALEFVPDRRGSLDRNLRPPRAGRHEAAGNESSGRLA